MANQTLNNGESGSVIRGKINDNFTELYNKTTSTVVSIQVLQSAVLTNQPNTEQELAAGSLSNQIKFKFDASKFDAIRITMWLNVSSTSANNPRVFPRYSTDNGSNFTVIGAGTIASGEAINLAATAGLVYVTSWITLPAGAKADVVFDVGQHGGDGAADPGVGLTHLQFRTATT